jgi:hypothetical protein
MSLADALTKDEKKIFLQGLTNAIAWAYCWIADNGWCITLIMHPRFFLVTLY